MSIHEDPLWDEWCASQWFERITLPDPEPPTWPEGAYSRLVRGLLQQPHETERLLSLLQEYVSRISRVTLRTDTPLERVHVTLSEQPHADVWVRSSAPIFGAFQGTQGMPYSTRQALSERFGLELLGDAWAAFHSTLQNSPFPWRDEPLPLRHCAPRTVDFESSWVRKSRSDFRRLFHIACCTYSHSLHEAGEPIDPYEPLADLFALEAPLAVTRVHLRAAKTDTPLRRVDIALQLSTLPPES